MAEDWVFGPVICAYFNRPVCIEVVLLNCKVASNAFFITLLDRSYFELYR